MTGLRRPPQVSGSAMVAGILLQEALNAVLFSHHNVVNCLSIGLLDLGFEILSKW